MINLHQLKEETKVLVSKKIIEFLSENISYDEINELAVFVINNLGKINTLEEFLNFLDELNELYPPLKNEVIILKSKLNDNEEKQVIKKLQKYISAF